MLVSQNWGWDIVHILWNGRLVVVIEVVVRVLRRNWDLWLEFGKVGWYIVGLLSDWLSIRDVFTNRWGKVINLKTEGEKFSELHEGSCFHCLACTSWIMSKTLYGNIS